MSYPVSVYDDEPYWMAPAATMVTAWTYAIFPVVITGIYQDVLNHFSTAFTIISWSIAALNFGLWMPVAIFWIFTCRTDGCIQPNSTWKRWVRQSQWFSWLLGLLNFVWYLTLVIVAVVGDAADIDNPGYTAPLLGTFWSLIWQITYTILGRRSVINMEYWIDAEETWL